MHSIPESTPWITLDTQRFQAPLREASGEEIEERDQQEDVGVHNEEGQTWRLEGIEEEPGVNSL